MRKFKILFSVILIILLGLVVGLLAREPEGFVPRPLGKTTITQTTKTMSNISNWGYWMYASGKSAREPDGDSGGLYPRGTAGAIFTDGLVWGGKFAGKADDIRVGGSTYSTGTVSGWIDANGLAVSPSDERVKIWRIRPDYATLTYDQVRKDAMELNELGSLADVTDAMCQKVIDQYKEDWVNWPSDLGAPTYADGTPGIANADQVIWYVTNDLDRTACVGLYGSEPIGIELQVTAWAYAQPGARLGQILFKKYVFINKSGENITDMYVSQWSDPDLGNYGNDFVGCDTTLSLGFAYNGEETDDAYAAFGLAPAAVGYDFFQGPMVDGIAGQDVNRNGVDDAEDYAIWDLKKEGPGKINLPMSSFGWFASGSPISDPDLGVYDGTKQWYNLLSGYKPFDDLDNPSPWHLGNVDANAVTTYPLAGDPVTGEGYIDGQDSYFDPGDRRMCLTAGPFDFADGETQQVVVAVVGGLGNTNLSSLTDLKLTDAIAQDVFNNAFAGIPKAPINPKVNIIPFEDEIMLEWGSDASAVATSEEPIIAGYSFEGYNVYQLPSASSTIDDALKIATYDKDNGIKTILGKKFLAEYGVEVMVPVQKGFDNGVQRYFKIDKDYITGKPLYEGKTYYFAVTAYNYNAAPDLIEAKALESALIGQPVVVQEANPGDAANVEILSDFDVEHTVGSAGGYVTGKVIDPFATTGHDYEVYFNKQHYYLSGDGKWYTTNYPDSVAKLSKTTDLQGSYLVGASVYSTNAGTIDLKYWVNVVSPDYDYCEGVLLTFPSDITINSATSGNGVEIVLDKEANTVMFGNTIPTGGGAFAGGELITVNVNSFTPPLNADYKMFDDGWAVLSNYILGINTDVNPPDTTFAYDLGDGIVDAEGTVVISEIGNDFKTMNHWNVKDVSDSNKVVLEDQFVINGQTVEHIEDGIIVAGGGASNALTFDGVQLSVDVLYAAPSDYAKYTHIIPATDTTDAITDVFSGARATAWLNYDQHGKPFIITSYGMQHWANTALSIDTEGSGTTDVNYLQRDYEIRFTGEYDDPIQSNGQVYYPIKEGTGSKAIIFRARSGDLANHPDANNPGDGNPFFINIPFEVWDVDAEGGPRQISILLTDRLQTLADGDTTYAFNPSDRMYCEFLMVDYATVIDGNAADFVGHEMMTWNTVWWNCDWTTGDVIEFSYDNPIQFGSDTWTFTTVAPTLGDADLAKDALKKINVFPNPYYANNDLGTTRFDDYVSFTHLPQKATVRLFNLAGIQVRVLEKDDSSQFLKWDLQNEAGLPVGSGMYIAYIDLPDFDKDKVLKLVIIQKEQILKYY